MLTEEDFEVKVVTLEGGLDPDRFIRERGIKDYVEAVKGSQAALGLPHRPGDAAFSSSDG